MTVRGRTQRRERRSGYGSTARRPAGWTVAVLSNLGGAAQIVDEKANAFDPAGPLILQGRAAR
jgi:hypothetical protein